MDRHLLSDFLHITEPLGLTRPGYLPAAHLGGPEAVISQHHEGLHHSFNTLTALGNSLVLLSQIAEKCPEPLAGNARRIAEAWNNAQEARLEGLICYVSFKRANRRIDSLTVDLFEQVLTKPYRRLWSAVRDRYESLDLADDSKDALAVHVGTYCLNLPVYERLRDLAKLDQACGVVTQAILEQRFESLELELLSDEGRRLLDLWDSEMSRLWLEDTSQEEKQLHEADSIDSIFRKLVPQMASVPCRSVPESLFLADNWNQQLTAMGLGTQCTVQITNRGYVDAMKAVVIQTSNRSMSGLQMASSVADVIDRLNIDSRFGCLATFHRDRKGWCFSNKYERMTKPGETYVRFVFVQSDPDNSRVDLFDHNLFRILPPHDLPEWLRQLNHPRLVLTQSEPSEDLFPDFIRFSPLSSDQLWRFHWGTTISNAAKQIATCADKTEWIKAIEMTRSLSAFCLHRLEDREWLDVYPIPWDARDTISLQIQMVSDSGYLKLSDILVFGILGAVIRAGF